MMAPGATRFHIQHVVDDRLLTIRLSGIVDRPAVSAVVAEVFRLVNDHTPTRVLIDVHNVEGALSLGETYFHVREYPQATHGIRTAVIERSERHDLAVFQETTMRNAGQDVRFFLNEADALNWLKSD